MLLELWLVDMSRNVDIDICEDPNIGMYIVLTVDMDASKALEIWLKILEEVKDIGIPVFIYWTGKTDVSPEEMDRYIGKALAKMNIFPATIEPIDVMRIVGDLYGQL